MFGVVCAQVESGTHDSLLSKGDMYAQMWKRQAAGIMDDDVEDQVVPTSGAWRKTRTSLEATR